MDTPFTYHLDTLLEELKIEKRDLVKMLKRIGEENIDYVTRKILTQKGSTGGRPTTEYYLTRDMYKNIRMRRVMNMRNVEQLDLDELEETVIIRKRCIENITIGIIRAAFSNHNSVQQYIRDGYRLDLCFTELELVIECDENGHKPYNQAADLERQFNIETYHGMTFIRYNPDATNFNIGHVIRSILEYIENR